MHTTRRRIGRGHVFPPHAHPGWSVAVVEAGSGYIRLRRGSVAAGRGAVTVLYPGEAHSSTVHREDGLGYTVFDLDEAEAAAIHGSTSTPAFDSALVDDAGIARGLRKADRLRRAGEDLGADSILALALRALFARHAGADQADPAPSSAGVRAARDLLDTVPAGPITLAELAAAAGVSPATLVRRFVAETGLTPHRYLVSRRVDRAKIMLAGGMPAAQVAALAGFADQSHLHRHFTRDVGVTPGRFQAAT
ncbi:helix-turn-helix transcriptional regulator [Pseudonocardia sp. TRM90224]|uniref:helix-turn-helix transcriptional regulator n=1 Tax=Pseudonocardia sp. TRM90224 TaxID=2812678 RepID=UPI001E4601DF|nr:AraC family transcriptional regulator [Pseudonocardia sp. TRM90224]